MTPRILSIVALSAAALTLPARAPAHEWYPPACCSGRDCAEIVAPPAQAGGYHVRIKPGAHPMVNGAAFDKVIPYSTWKPSPDGKFHLCLNWQGAVLCAFAPPPGA